MTKHSKRDSNLYPANRPLSRDWTRRAMLAASGLAAATCTSWACEPRRRSVPWLHEIQTPPKNSEPAATSNRPLAPLLIDEQGQPITTVTEWERRRTRLLSEWRKFLGIATLPHPKRLKVDIVEEDRDGGVLRKRIRYEVEPGWVTEAYWLEPLIIDSPCPAAVVLHSTVDHSIRQPAGLAEDREKAFGLELSKRGFITISPRNYLWPTNDRIAANEEAQRFLDGHAAAKGMAKMLLDAQLAVDLLLQSPHVDARRIASAGHSLGAKEVLYLAAFDERISVTVSSEGGIGTGFSNWDAPWYLGESIKGENFRREHHELVAAIAPRPFLLIGGDSADGDRSWPYIASALPVYRLYGDEPALGLYNHRQGHAVPPECERRIYEWIESYV